MGFLTYSAGQTSTNKARKLCLRQAGVRECSKLGRPINRRHCRRPGKDLEKKQEVPCLGKEGMLQRIKQLMQWRMAALRVN